MPNRSDVLGELIGSVNKACPRLLTPTDCVKDRLAAYFYWNDTMAFEQALLVAREQPTDIADLRRWARAEGEADKLARFEEALGSD